ncbi:MAG: hypothetical protein KF763_02525 [Cyclobacteriaceae bacterium]|nr:hypothetical protein [Cyclobacteriaceae bacterium]
MKKIPHVIIYTDHDLAHNSFWDSLMIREAVKGSITLQFKKRAYGKSISRLFTTYTEIFSNDSVKRIVVDFHDNYDFISQDNLQQCDVYYKVNYRTEYIQTVNNSYCEKIKPFIPHFTVSGEQDISILPRLVGSWTERINYYSLLKLKNFNLRKVLYQSGPARLKRYRTFVKFGNNEKYASIKPIQNRIFFIASLYHDSSDQLKEVNTRRINLVGLLKREYGKHFYGGIINSELSRNQCPELIFQDYLPHTRYLEECKRSDICIYSNGPNNCLSWKLGEYIWLGMPVVSEKLYVDFDSSFNLANHLVEANNLDAMLHSIESLRNDRAKKEFMIYTNQGFYNGTLELLQPHIQ